VFDKVLIANRGEIACRVIRACRARGITAVAVYSEADAGAVHVRMADEAYCIGPPPSRESYLVGDKILAVAKQCGAQAIHPGYGFLSENASFREQCEAAGITFIGPSAEAMRLMGEKTLARQTMIAANVPVVPGNAKPLEDHEEIKSTAAEIGYPVMLKAAAGGGGKGMRIVASEADIIKAFEGARREAINSFSDDRVYMEKAIIGPRHIEVQVMADSHGNVVYVGDRECSVQRRHQKVIEEAPAANLSPETKRKMGEMACQAARAVGYVNAGTVECLVDAYENFYFLEMNTRLQVEHCASEEAYGVDLVDAQLTVAAGGELPWTQEDLVPQAHAIELRLYAEDPYNNYMPSPGHIHVYRVPKGPGVRIDDGVEQGSEISSLYDPMIAKLIVRAESRSACITRALQVLDEYEVEGIRTNLALLKHVLRAKPFVEGKYTTGILKEIDPLVLEEPGPETALVARVLAALAVHGKSVKKPAAAAEATSNGSALSQWGQDGLRRQMRGDL